MSTFLKRTGRDKQGRKIKPSNNPNAFNTAKLEKPIRDKTGKKLN